MIKSGSLLTQIESFGILAPIIFVLLKASTLVVAPLSGTPLYFVAGGLFGNFNGLILSLLGDVLGSSICFMLSRFYGYKVVKTFVGDKFFERITNTMGVIKDSKSFIKARITLFAMPEILAYASGFSKINFLTFSLINTFFYLLADGLLVFSGHEIVAIIAQHTFWFYFLTVLISISGFWFLYKDYKNSEKIQGM